MKWFLLVFLAFMFLFPSLVSAASINSTNYTSHIFIVPGVTGASENITSSVYIDSISANISSQNYSAYIGVVFALDPCYKNFTISSIDNDEAITVGLITHWNYTYIVDVKSGKCDHYANMTLPNMPNMSMVEIVNNTKISSYSYNTATRRLRWIMYNVSTGRTNVTIRFNGTGVWITNHKLWWSDTGIHYEYNSTLNVTIGMPDKVNYNLTTGDLLHWNKKDRYKEFLNGVTDNITLYDYMLSKGHVGIILRNLTEMLNNVSVNYTLTGTLDAPTTIGGGGSPPATPAEFINMTIVMPKHDSIMPMLPNRTCQPGYSLVVASDLPYSIRQAYNLTNDTQMVCRKDYPFQQTISGAWEWALANPVIAGVFLLFMGLIATVAISNKQLKKFIKER